MIIDLQYMYSGVELIGVAPLVNQIPVKEYNEEKYLQLPASF